VRSMDVMKINGKKAVFAYGRFENINNVNKELVRKMLLRAKNTSADPYIIVTHTGTGAAAKKDKIKGIFPNIQVLSTSSADPKLASVVNSLKRNKDYKNIEMVARTNSVDQFKKFMSIPVFNSGVSRPKTTKAAPKKAKAAIKKPKGTSKPKSKKDPYTRKFVKSNRNVRALGKMMKNL